MLNLKNKSEKKLIIKLNSCSDKNFLSPIVTTVKTDEIVKLALGSKVLNRSIHKNKHQMPNIENLIEYSTKYQYKRFKWNSILLNIGFEISLQSIKFRLGNLPPLQL